jgi:hypothetical protein
MEEREHLAATGVVERKPRRQVFEELRPGGVVLVVGVALTDVDD